MSLVTYRTTAAESKILSVLKGHLKVMNNTFRYAHYHVLDAFSFFPSTAYIKLLSQRGKAPEIVNLYNVPFSLYLIQLTNAVSKI